MCDRLTISVIVGTSTDAHSFRSQVGMGSESDCLFGQLDRILWISDSEAGVKVEKTGGVAEGEGRCGEVVVGLLARDRRSLDILSMKKEAKLSARHLGQRKVRVKKILVLRCGLIMITLNVHV